MNFNVDLKKMVRDAGTVVNRVVQLTGEKLGTSEKTELDAHFENLAERSDITKTWTEKILKNTESVLTPHPGNRVEDYLLEKIEKKRPNRLSNLEYLGQDMIDAGNEFGPGTPYGSTLLKVGQSEQKLGKIEREFISNTSACFLSPLKKYLDGEMKTIMTERGVLESKRLDLDACKNRVRKARSMLGQQTEGPSPEYLLQQAERDLRVAQAEFDRQVEITKLLLESVSNSHSSHLRCLHDLVDAQLLYFQQCTSALQDLKNEISKKKMRAKVLCGYDARNSQEISLIADEIINVEIISDSEKDYIIAIRGDQRGRVPLAYLEILQN
ncbi:SH3 domain containing GRB2 like, endophilin-B isoform X2 [Rhodnius prolixus]|uniref:SH3 domain containing GRB2 like, endophilin-B isoform X2 n=1 Tax=Rhodnius prolixus TaxID=13249 RepID=UPI003D18EF1E